MDAAFNGKFAIYTLISFTVWNAGTHLASYIRIAPNKSTRVLAFYRLWQEASKRFIQSRISVSF